MGSSFGEAFRVTTFGESHGAAVGCVVEGCPPGLPISPEEVQQELDRRRPGQSRLTTQRAEPDHVEILSGIFDGVTIGTPIAMCVRNQDSRSKDYEPMRDKFRPSHADFTYDEKYGVRAWAGGGRASARETIGRVAAGAIAKSVLNRAFGTETVAWVDECHGAHADVDAMSVDRLAVDANIVRCPDLVAAQKFEEAIESARKSGDTVGGCVRCVVRNVPPGWGEPVFDKAEALLAQALMSLPASKGFEIGSGFTGTSMLGTEHNDAFRAESGNVFTPTNRSGGVQGGITNGMPILLRVAFKPVSTVMREQDTVDMNRQNTTITGRGRHDPCVLPRAVPMVEAMVNLVLADLALRHMGMRALANRIQSLP